MLETYNNPVAGRIYAPRPEYDGKITATLRAIWAALGHEGRAPWTPSSAGDAHTLVVDAHTRLPNASASGVGGDGRAAAPAASERSGRRQRQQAPSLPAQLARRCAFWERQGFIGRYSWNN